jgi:hypothetical protein
MDSGPPKKEAATYLAATDMPAYNIIDPDTLHVTATADLIFTFGNYSSFLNIIFFKFRLVVIEVGSWKKYQTGKVHTFIENGIKLCKSIIIL